MSDQATILAVDDTPVMLGLLVELLTAAGYRVRTASSGEAALASVAACPPDLILLDVRMPGLDGFEVCRRLEAGEQTRHIPVILLSAFASVAEWVTGLRLGAADFVTKPFQPEDLLTRVRTHLALYQATESLEQQAAELRRANEQLRAEGAERERVEAELRQTLARDGRSRRALLSVLEDQKRAETERERLIAAIEQSGEMIVVTDTAGAIVFVNPAFEAVTGYTRAEVLGENPRLLESGLPGETPYDTVWQTVHRGEIWRGRKVGKRKDGTFFTEDAIISPVRDPAGTITAYVAVKRDISRALALEAQFLQAQKMEGIGRLAGGVAHDFNNLLSVILSYTAFALDAVQPGDPLREDLLEIRTAGQRAASLTRQLLAFSRKQMLRPEPLDLNVVLADMESMLQQMLGEDIDLVQRPAPHLGLVRADPGQIGQVIMNLAINARDAMPDGGKLTLATADVELDEEFAAQHPSVAPGPHVMLAVTDSGVGMDEPTKARIFEPFFTTKELGKGTGLGLSTVYGIVKQSGGSIWVDSEPGRGTTFEIYLPADLSLAREAPRSRTSPPPARGVETILVVEDGEALVKVARRTLEAAGYTVLSASNGEEALEASAQHPAEIHLLLTDVVMPRLGGWATAERLNATRPGMKVLFMSGYTDDAIVHRGMLGAGMHFLAKPFDVAELTRKVREVLDGRPVRAGEG